MVTQKMSKKVGKNVTKTLGGKYIQKFLGHAEQSATDCFKKDSSKNSRRNW